MKGRKYDNVVIINYGCFSSDNWIEEDGQMGLNNRLKEYRAKIDVNQQQLGSMVGASRQTISLIERGDYSPSVTLAIKIARVFNANVEDIFLYEEDGE